MINEGEEKFKQDDLLEGLDYLKKQALQGIPPPAFGIIGQVEESYKKIRKYIMNDVEKEI